MINFFPPDLGSTLHFDSLHAIQHAFVARRYRALVIMSADEIIKEAAMIADRQGRTATAADPNFTVNLNQWFDIEEPGNRPIIFSHLDMTMSEIEHSISAIGTGRACMDASLDVHLHSRKEYTTEVWVSGQTTDTIVNHFALAIKQAMVNSLLSKWSSLTYPEVSEYWQAQKELSMNAVYTAALHLQPKKIQVRHYPSW